MMSHKKPQQFSNDSTHNENKELRYPWGKDEIPKRNWKIF